MIISQHISLSTSQITRDSEMIELDLLDLLRVNLHVMINHMMKIVHINHVNFSRIMTIQTRLISILSSFTNLNQVRTTLTKLKNHLLQIQTRIHILFVQIHLEMIHLLRMNRIDQTELRDLHRFFLDSMISIEETKTIIIKKRTI